MLRVRQLRDDERLLVAGGPISGSQEHDDRRSGEAAGGREARPASLDLVEETVRVAGLELRLLRPRDLDALIDEEAFRKDEFIPYWAELWPSGRALAEALAPDIEGRVLELGCGLGVPSLVAAHRGAEVTAVDWSIDAVEVLRRNAVRNGVRLRAEAVDWGSPQWLVDRGPWNLVLAADVLYERRHVDPLIDLLPRLGTEVLLADPGRQALEDFLEGAADQWDIQDVAAQVVRLRARRGDR